ncbi:FAD dependent oxidoreductase [Phyllosticta citribraziliensis]|uniref:FAD dependent oxidoreductase n=1 Tax=Phyllosticta citribraziliensis TaxID=989973 RepID=A0ABR1LHX7_9PEZI
MNESVIVIGSGTWGTSTALELAKRGYTNVTCLDKRPFPSVDSAAYDLNKIIRTEYDEELYSEMAIEAIQAWRQPMFDGIFHETGWLVTTSGDPEAARRLRQAYQNLVDRDQAKGVEFVEGKADIVKHVPQLAQAKGIADWKGFWNPQAGWAHARNALEKVGSEAMKLGVKFIGGPEGQMTGLSISPSGSLLGIKVASGAIHSASHYILSTGAASPALLPSLLAPHLWSKCWTLGHIECDDAELAAFAGCPVVDNRELGFFFEPDRATRRLKLCNEFQGYQYRVGRTTSPRGDGTPLDFSVPYYASEHPGEPIPDEALAGMRRLVDAVLPQFSGRDIVGASICWCTDTADRHFLIDRHPRFPQLLLATGDSGHAFKFLPTMGSYIVDALEGKPRGLKKEWSLRERQWGHDDSRPGERVKDLREVGMGVGGGDETKSKL